MGFSPRPSNIKNTIPVSIRTLLAISVTITAALGLRSEVRWLEFGHDFGLFKEAAGPQHARNRLVNLGPDTVSVFSVRPSCGCTSVDFDDRPLAPGDTASVSFAYDPHLRPGKFEKSVKVRLSDGSHYSLPIRGNVLGTPESLATLFPVDAGDIRLTERIVDLGQVTPTRIPTAFVNAYILSPDSLPVSIETSTPAVHAEASTSKAGPGDMVTLTVTLDGRRFASYGPLVGEVRLLSGPGRDPVTVEVRAHALPDAAMLTRMQGEAHPSVRVADTALDFGSVSASGRPVTHEVEISNIGKAPLEIYALWSDSAAVTHGKLPNPVKPGKSARIRLTLDPRGLPAGPLRVTAGVVANDPDRTEIPLVISALID